MAKQIHTEVNDHPSIDFREETMNVRLRWNQEKFRAALLKFMGPKAADEYRNRDETGISYRATTVLINRQIAL